MMRGPMYFDRIYGGVISQNECHDFIFDEIDYGIDLDFYEHEKDCKEEYHDNCYESDNSTMLIGFKFDEESGKFIEDENSDYSYIYHEGILQITHSKYIKFADQCSPCYPLQCNLTSNGNLKTYSLPLEDYREDLQENIRIFTVEELETYEKAIKTLESTGLFSWKSTDENITELEKIQRIDEMLKYFETENDRNEGTYYLPVSDIPECFYTSEYGYLQEIEFLLTEELKEEFPNESEEWYEKESEVHRKLQYLVYPCTCHIDIIFQK